MNRDEEALAVIGSWEWDEIHGPFTRSLSETINDLALTGIVGPEKAVLSLLANGQLQAWGRCNWKKFQDGEFQKQGNFNIHVRHWQALRDGLAVWHPIKGPYVKFAILEWDSGSEDEHPIVNWDWQSDCFHVNQQTGEFLEADYLEEAFSAFEIQIYPPSNGLASGNVSMASESNGGGRPPALDWEAVALEMAGQFYRGDLKPRSIADVKRAIRAWVNDPEGGPADSTIHPHAKAIFEAFKSWEADL